MQVDATSREGPGRALEQAAQAYLRSLRGKRRDEPPPSLSEETIDTLRRVITSVIYVCKSKCRYSQLDG
jgi:hypothetical protein